jgi:hypothetical protein
MRALSILSFVLAIVTGCGPSTTASDCTTDECVSGQRCDPGATAACYTGPAGTEGVSICHGGTRRCTDTGYWGTCEGEVTPTVDVCGNNVDENCDGIADNVTDDDGDGFTNCAGDCCDAPGQGCAQPELVNPGAFEVLGNNVDDDCDGNVDNVVAATCDAGLASNSNNAIDYAKAMDLCQEAVGDRWGVRSARFVRADGTSAPLAVQRAIRPGFGATSVQHGSSMVVISTAHAAAPGQTNPSHSTWESTMHDTESGFPADWFAANGNDLPNAPGCPGPEGRIAYDSVMLELLIRVPTNARSFSMRVNFMSAEYPEWTCSEFNDFFVVLLDSGWNGSPANPGDKNLAFYSDAQDRRYPVGVNLAHGNTGLFTVCKNGPTGCLGVDGTINTCVSTDELQGTGMEAAVGGCGSNNLMGGGTGWLTTRGNVIGGEDIRLRIALWDTSDSELDSVAMIDGFQWSVESSDPGTVIVN